MFPTSTNTNHNPPHRNPVGLLHPNRDRTGQRHVSIKQGPTRPHSSACKMLPSASTKLYTALGTAQSAGEKHRHLCEDGQTRLLDIKSLPPNSAAQLSGQGPRGAYGYSPGLPVRSLQPTPSGPNRRPWATLRNRRGNCHHPYHRSRQKGQEDHLSPLHGCSTTSPERGYSPPCTNWVFQSRLGTGPATSPLTDRQSSVASKNRSNWSRQGSHKAHRHRPSSSWSTSGHCSTNLTSNNRLLNTKLHR